VPSSPPRLHCNAVLRDSKVLRSRGNERLGPFLLGC
jgi:hypothetical protein